MRDSTNFLINFFLSVETKISWSVCLFKAFYPSIIYPDKARGLPIDLDTVRCSTKVGYPTLKYCLKMLATDKHSSLFCCKVKI